MKIKVYHILGWVVVILMVLGLHLGWVEQNPTFKGLVTVTSIPISTIFLVNLISDNWDKVIFKV